MKLYETDAPCIFLRRRTSAESACVALRLVERVFCVLYVPTYRLGECFAATLHVHSRNLRPNGLVFFVF